MPADSYIISSKVKEKIFLCSEVEYGIQDERMAQFYARYR